MADAEGLTLQEYQKNCALEWREAKQELKLYVLILYRWCCKPELYQTSL